jgi:hypothetical protein
VQLAGINNINRKESNGIQLAGINNHCDSSFKGVQLASISNHTRRTMKGVQLASLYNYAHKIKGVQFALVNVADTMNGIGIGLINIYGNGLNKLVVSSSDIQQINLGYLSGTKHFYSIIGIGANADRSHQLYSTYYGVGTCVKLSSKLSIHPECYGQVFYLGDWDYVPLVGRMQINLTYQIHAKLELFAGSSFSVTENRKGTSLKDFSPWLNAPNIQYHTINNNQLATWLGWQVGLRIF